MQLFIYIILTLTCQLSIALEQYGPYNTELAKVVDGDTIDVALHVYPGQTNDTRIRLAIIDTPEIFKPKSPCEKKLGMEAKSFVTDFLNSGQIKTTITGKGYYGRTLAKLSVNGVDLGDELLKAGLGRIYEPDKSKRKPWCN